ncbi:MAG: FG-GAP-like repeat-containing protein [Acidobacteriota bacterium]|nr:FG-GAP-like repeat-containing protein [Acidobacteriota bacterium]
MPKPESKEYRNLVSAFYVGLAGLQTGEDVRAKDKLTLATQIAPGEPASWANLGLLAVRQQEFEVAYEKVEKARSLAPDNSQIEALLGLIESRRGKLPEAIAHLKKAVELDAKNLKALYALAQETERQATETSDAEAQKLLERILAVQPVNLHVLLEVTRLAAKRGDAQTLQMSIGRIVEGPSSDGSEEVNTQLLKLKQVAASSDLRALATQAAILKNVLARVPAYRESVNAVRTPAEFVGDPFLKFIKLPSPSSQPAPPDTAMTFEVQPIAGLPEGKWSWAGIVAMDANSKPVLVVASESEVRIVGGATLSFPAGKRENVPPFEPLAYGVLAIDLNYDFKTDFVLAGHGGLRIYLQENPGKFTEMTSRVGLSPSTLTSGLGGGAKAFDFDLDGDLDVLLMPTEGTPIVLRNNGDVKFKELTPFPSVIRPRDFVAADIDGDGDPDLAFVTEGALKVFINERLGQYRERSTPELPNTAFAVASADIDQDGQLDFIVECDGGQVVRLSDKGQDNWKQSELIPNGALSRPIIASDLDNNGSLDLVIGNTIWLMNPQGRMSSLPISFNGSFFSAADLTGNGRLDLIGRLGRMSGGVVQFTNRGTKNYHSQTIRTRASQSTGDQRINSFGIGGEIEIRSGLLTQKQVITSPLLHFGLGENTQTDVARIVWPNGAVQAEFELKADNSVLAEQRLKGSCPTLFAWDGKQMSFVKDCSPWNPALGLHINAQVVANVEQTEEWFKIPGSAVAPKDGFYDLRVTGELWEAFYIDRYSLMAVDHPPGTEVFTDERFTMPQPKPQLYVTQTPKLFASAKDDRGQDVSAIVAALDQQYLDTFGRGQYQGVTRDHWVELELGEEAPRDKKLYLIGHGWLHPTDATINIAIGQGSSAPPQGLSLEVQDAHGNWIVAKPGLGFLSGKLKTMVIDLDGVFRPGAARRLRLRTNMEIYWDKLEWAEAAAFSKSPGDQVKVQRLETASADLRYRGFSEITQVNASSPELPDYNRLEGTAQKWRDLAGYYTRYGDVRELLAKTDDRMLIMNAGDELRLKFKALTSPPAGWTRDFVMIGDGWTKDGDYNCAYAATVLPLPFHGIKDYNRASTRLKDNPAYKRYAQDWQTYHTRYVTPDSFVRALR